MGTGVHKRVWFYSIYSTLPNLKQFHELKKRLQLRRNLVNRLLILLPTLWLVRSSKTSIIHIEHRFKNRISLSSLSLCVSLSVTTNQLMLFICNFPLSIYKSNLKITLQKEVTIAFL